MLAFQELLKQRLIPRVKDLAESFRQERIQRVRDQESDNLNDLLDLIQAQFAGRFTRDFLRANITEIFSRLQNEAFTQAERDLAVQQIAITPAAADLEAIESAINDVVTNFGMNTERMVQSVRNEISSGIASGERWESIARRLEQSPTSTREIDGQKSVLNRAVNDFKFTARNAVTTSLGQINRSRQESAGIELYIWQTSDDERVRPTHENLDNRIFSWDPNGTTVNGVEYQPARDPQFRGGAATIPGEPWNCRCVAIPYQPEEEETEESLE